VQSKALTCSIRCNANHDSIKYNAIAGMNTPEGFQPNMLVLPQAELLKLVEHCQYSLAVIPTRACMPHYASTRRHPTMLISYCSLTVFLSHSNISTSQYAVHTASYYCPTMHATHPRACIALIYNLSQHSPRSRHPKNNNV
jgi:hypothetical protein